MRTRLLLWLSVGVSLLAVVMLLPFLAGTSFAAAPPDSPDAPSATIFTVKTPGDTLVTTGCTGSAGECTLRGALKLANDALGSKVIHFDPTLNGTPIVLSNTLVITGSSIFIEGNGTELTLIHAAFDRPAFTMGAGSNSIFNLGVFGDGASGGDLQDGVFIYSGTNHLLFQLALYNLGGSGVQALGPGSNEINASYIGTYLVGSAVSSACDKPNRKWGVVLRSQGNELIHNTIGCNLMDGVIVDGALGNTLVGNHIGVTSPFTQIANTAGVVLVNGASANRIGKAGYDPNVIARNTQNGIYIGGAATNANRVQNNHIGTAPLNPTTTVFVGNDLNGIWINNFAHDNIVGGSFMTESNRIGGNYANGVLISNSPDNQVLRNNINLNHGNGMLLQGISTTGTLISATVIANSGYLVSSPVSGIRESSGAGNNVWSHIQSAFNKGMGVDKDPTANALDAPYPVITSALTSGPFVTITGKASPSIGFLFTTRVEVYGVVVNTNGFTDGYFYAGTTFADANGNWTVVTQSYFGSCFMAFQTRSSLLGPLNSSSEFGPTNCRTFLPVIVR